MAALAAGILLNAPTASAVVKLPRQLNADDRKEATRILGFSSSAKILSDPYPLGGYSGVQVGALIEDIPLDDLAGLGTKLASPQGDMQIGGISIAKGVYDNLDLFLQWTPYSNGTQVETWGGMVRWGFYQASFLPLSFSVAVRGTYGSFDNQIATTALGLDLTAGLNVNNIAIFVGIGPQYASGRFVGGSDGSGGLPLTDSAMTETASVTGLHSMIGLSFEYSWAFFVAELDHYSETVYSGQVGVRF